jgi:hypothetical protein
MLGFKELYEKFHRTNLRPNIGGGFMKWNIRDWTFLTVFCCSCIRLWYLLGLCVKCITNKFRKIEIIRKLFFLLQGIGSPDRDVRIRFIERNWNKPWRILLVYVEWMKTLPTQSESDRRFSSSDFFHESVSPGPLSIPLVQLWIFPKILGDIRNLVLLHTCVNNATDKSLPVALLVCYRIRINCLCHWHLWLSLISDFHRFHATGD